MNVSPSSNSMLDSSTISSAEARNNEAAEACFLAAIDKDPNDSYTWHQLSLLYLEGFRDMTRAQEAVERAVAANASNYAAWVTLGNIVKQTDPVRGMQCYDKALSYNSNYSRALKNKGLLYMAQKKFSHAITYFDKALEVDPHNASVYLALGQLYQLLREWDKAESYMQGAIVADPQNPSAFTGRGVLLERKGNLAGAQMLYEAALRLDPYDTKTSLKLARVVPEKDVGLFVLAAAFQHAVAYLRTSVREAIRRHIADHFPEQFLTPEEEREGRWHKYYTPTPLEVEEELKRSMMGYYYLLGGDGHSGSSPSGSFGPGDPGWSTTSTAATSGMSPLGNHPTCPRGHTMGIVRKKPSTYRPRATWACEECKKSIGGPLLQINGAYYCRQCKYDLCIACSRAARIAHFCPEPPRVLGRGAFGTVQREFVREVGTYCAVKRIPKAFATNVRQEVTLMQMFVNQPQVVKVLHFESDVTEVRVVMELMDGSLGSLIRSEGPMHERQLRHVLLQSCQGLAALHGAPSPVIHRDVKPDNLLYKRKEPPPAGVTDAGAAAPWIVKLGDFGISKVSAGTHMQQTDDATSRLIGTPQYLAPECLREPPKWTPSADIWALACTCIALSTGAHPYAGIQWMEHPTMFQMAQAFRDHPDLRPVIPSYLSVALQEVLLSMLHPLRNKRSSANDLITVLQRLVAESPSAVEQRTMVGVEVAGYDATIELQSHYEARVAAYWAAQNQVKGADPSSNAISAVQQRASSSSYSGHDEERWFPSGATTLGTIGGSGSGAAAAAGSTTATIVVGNPIDSGMGGGGPPPFANAAPVGVGVSHSGGSTTTAVTSISSPLLTTTMPQMRMVGSTSNAAQSGGGTSSSSFFVSRRDTVSPDLDAEHYYGPGGSGGGGGASSSDERAMSSIGAAASWKRWAALSWRSWKMEWRVHRWKGRRVRIVFAVMFIVLCLCGLLAL